MERILIGSVQLNNTQNGRPVAELYSTDTRLKYPVLRLFDLSALITVGLEPGQLEPGQRHVARFWAYYRESDKTNAQGNPYKDVEYLEPIDTPATATSVAGPDGDRGDTSALLDELRAIRAYLKAIARKLEVSMDTPNGAKLELCPECHTRPCVCPELEGPEDERGDDDPTLRYANGDPVSDNDAEIKAFQAHVDAECKIPSDVEALRQWVLATAKKAS